MAISFPDACRCAFVVGLLLAAGPAAVGQPTHTEADIVAAVRHHSLALAAAQAGAAAEAERPAQVRWAFPMVEAMVMPQMIADGELGLGLAARQTFPQAGRLRADREARRAAAEAATYGAQEVEREVILTAREAYAELWGLQERIARVDTFRARLALYRESALAQVRTGRGPQQAVLNLQLESDLLAQRLEALNETGSGLRARLVALSGGALRLGPEDRLVPPEVDRESGEDLAAAIATHPSVAAGEAMRDAEEAMTRMRGTMGRPEFTVGAAVSLSSMARDGRYGQQLVTPMVGVMVPLWRESVRAEVRESQERARQRGLEADQARVALAAEAEDAVAQLTHVRQRIDRTERDLMPTVQQALESVLAGYRTGSVRFLELLDAQRTAFSIDLDLIEARVLEAVLIARIDAITGA